MTIKHCIACNKELINRRPQTKTCKDACRARYWRQTRVTKLPVSFMLNIANYALIKKASESAGVTINQYAHDQLVQTMEASPW
jgi:predicted nucleic acid-binding Zn ribbon protein